MDKGLHTLATATTLRARLSALAAQCARVGADGVIITPGSDMRYLLGQSVASHERLTCLTVPAAGPATLIVPELERLGWAGADVDGLGVTMATWVDGQDPYRLAASHLGPDVSSLAVSDDMPTMHALRLRDAAPGSSLMLAGEIVARLRMRKDATEQAALRSVGAAIDRVHRRVGEWLRPGRTEREVAADIAAAIVAEGHALADFVIVGSGPNGASPHHEASDRVIGVGEAVVIDIGGPAPSGYNSDSTRTYLTGGEPVDDEFFTVHEIVRRAQQAGVAAARPGRLAQDVDAASREVIEQAGYGEYFITRTGHGIGLDVHEHPYLVAGNEQALEPGMAFSVEPGIYLPGRFGVRIEDILIVTDGEPELCNTAPTELIVLG